MELNGKNALVTGASTGIGREIAVALGGEGAQVALVSRSADDLGETREMIADQGGEAEVFPADLAKEEEIEDLWSGIEESWGSVDILVNAAGVWHGDGEVYYGDTLEDTPTEQVKEVMDVGARAPILLAQKVLPGMKEDGRGKIINISGTFESGASGWLHYYVSKKALEDFTRGLSEEVAEHGLQVNCISPSDTLTEAYEEFFPDYDEDEVLDPEEVAELAVYLVENDHISGQVIEIRNRDAYGS